MDSSQAIDKILEEQEKSKIKPDDVMNDIGGSNKRLQLAITVCSFTWALGALSLMQSAFNIKRQCENCTDYMITISDEFELHGDRDYMSAWSTSFFMLGNMLGATGFTHAADRWGRRRMLIICVLTQFVLNLLVGFAPSFTLFCGLRVIQGASYTGTNLIGWVAGYELSPASLRSFTTLIFGITWVLGYCAVAPLAYICSTWRMMMLMATSPFVVYILLVYFFVPETLHFLVSKKGEENVDKWIKKFDSKANAKLSAKLLVNEEEAQEDEAITKKRTHFVSEVWKNKKFIVFFIIQIYLWTCDMFIYFGLSLYSTNLSGNIYVNYFLMGLIEVPACILTPIVLAKYGRKSVCSGCHLLAAASFFSGIILPASDWVVLLCWLFSKFAVCISFMSLFVYATEIFPTNIRNVSIGICSVISRAGGIAAPYISSLEVISPLAPLILLTAICFVAGVLTLLLPETNKKPLPTEIGS